ncbi:UNVERIFIED_CONTAM: hypothetical protein GTU68_042174 [Idotea baltica]|nr:hypothetical protein [Idotea baltica]
MKLNLLAVGNKMPDWEIAPAKRGKSGNAKQWMQEEGDRILTAIPSNHHVVSLDVAGKPWNTKQLAKQLDQWLADGRDVSLLIGGPDGLSEKCSQRADQKWSLSALTLPHPIVRIVLAEQLYRAWTVLQNHPYHRA